MSKPLVIEAPHRSVRFVALMLAALLLGQALSASAVPCTMPGGDHVSQAGMDHSMHDMPTGMDHASHHMPSPPDVADSSAACCSAGGPCSMSACLALPALTASVAAGLAPRATSHAIWHSPPSPETASELFYRPPIVS